MKQMLADNPDIKVEITVDYGLADVVADRFDAGVRLGGEMAKDMIAVRIGPDIPMAIVGAPDYFQMHPAPGSPAQLIDHRAINLRLPTAGTFNKWRLMRGGRETRVRVLSRFTPDLPGYHLYYPHRRHASSAFTLLVETLRHRG